MENQGWTLVARFSNNDTKHWITNASFWYDRETPYGNVSSPFSNTDMISTAFWKVKGDEMKITRSDDFNHTALLQTRSNCLQGRTFRSKITNFGNFRNGTVWASYKCRGNCPVTYGGKYRNTTGFEKYKCSANIQSGNFIGFWCHWIGDGSVMMIGGGGTNCDRADHGIGITEENEAKFGPRHDGYGDFGNINNYTSTAPTSYSLCLWVY